MSLWKVRLIALEISRTMEVRRRRRFSYVDTKKCVENWIKRLGDWCWCCRSLSDEVFA